MASRPSAEHALDVRAQASTSTTWSQPDTGEQALEIAEVLIRSNAIDVVVIDSVAALVPRAEIEGEMGDSHVGLQARLMSQALRKLTGAVNRSHTAVVFTNQIREKVGVMFGSPETTSGGRALKFYASVRLDIRRIGAVKDGQDVVGNRTRVKVVKNKCAPPFRQAEFDIQYNQGVSHTGLLVDLGVDHGIVDKSGSWYSYGDLRLGRTRRPSWTRTRTSPTRSRRSSSRCSGWTREATTTSPPRARATTRTRTADRTATEDRTATDDRPATAHRRATDAPRRRLVRPV